LLCRCGEKVLLPRQAPEPSQDPQAIVEATILHVMDVLNEGLPKKESIGARVMQIQHLLRQEREIKRPKQKYLAARLGVSEPCVSVGLNRARGVLARLRDVNIPSTKTPGL
jgi:hypothetical protein